MNQVSGMIHFCAPEISKKRVSWKRREGDPIVLTGAHIGSLSLLLDEDDTKDYTAYCRQMTAFVP